MKGKILIPCISVFFFSFFLVIPSWVKAHCDTLEGPVVLAAKTALEKMDVNPVLNG